MTLTLNARQAQTWNPDRMDPQRAVVLRRQILADIRRRFKAVKQRIVEHVHINDAFGLTENGYAPGRLLCLGRAPVAGDRVEYRFQTVTNADPRFHFLTTPEQLKAFQAWVRQLMQQEVLGRSEDELWKKYSEQAWKQGAGRSWDDVRQSQLRAERPDLFLPGKQNELRDFYQGSREEFLRSAFNRPVGIEKLKVLAARTFTDLKGVTDALIPKLSRTLLDGMASGASPGEVAKGLAKAMDWALPRAETVARTEIARAYVEGQLDSLENLGVDRLGVMVEWATAGDSAVCPLCEPLEGAVLKIDEARGMFPRHPNCRCALLPANVGEDEQGQKRGQKKVQKAIDESAGLGGPSWAGADKRIAKKRPEAIV